MKQPVASPVSTEERDCRKLSPRRRAYEVTMRSLLYLCAGITCALLLFLIGYILYRGLPGLSWEFLTSQESILKKTDGILPAIQNTIYVIIVTLIFIMPLGVGSAIYLTEYASNRKLVTAIEFATETLSGIPSILYALVGMLVFCQFLNLGKTLIAGAFTLVIMTLPTIIRTTQESLKTVPASYREGALGLGAGKWHMIRTIVLPSSIDGIVTGCILAIGRIVGESAVLMFTAGMSTAMQDFFGKGGLFKSSGATLTVALYVYAKERAKYDLAFSVAVVLLVITFGINLCAKVMGKRMKGNKGGEKK
ncbi:phosphate ABC transporter permease PstA [Angelakisella massiliensis]|uniref:phosphate ABC transporter permease PstA n=1 Tax=Angelakisella massiliensis TaxID=1871018 RepID=UPI0008F84DB7|nr:phosphate ABC transporter permease PstA [Angelakisella massiliensis]